MRPGPAFSVVMPLWNKEREVARAIRSVLEQRCGELELIVVDDGSTDGSRAAVERIVDPRIRMVEQPNGGVSAARNTGVARATAATVAFLDADDEWKPEFLERIARLMQRYPAAAVFATGRLVDMGGGRVHVARVAGVPADRDGLVPDYYATTGLLAPSSTAVRREAFAAAGGFREGVAFGEDADLWLRLAAVHPVAFDPCPSAIWHCDASNRACEREPGSSLDVLRSSLRELERAPHVPDPVRRAARRHVAEIGLAEAERMLARGHPAAARELLRRWRETFTPNARYQALRLASACPAAVLRTVARAGAGAKRIARR